MFALHVSTVLVAGLLVVATVGAVTFTRTVVRTDARRALRERAAEVGVVLTTSISELAVGLQTLGQVARVTGEAQGPFMTTARALTGAQAGVSYALLRPVPGGFQVVLGSGAAFRVGEVVTGPQVAALDTALAARQLVSTPVIGGGADRRFGVAVGPPASPAGTVVYRESLLGPLGPPKAASTAPFHELEAVLYAGARPVPTEALVSTAHALPLHGTVQDQYLAIGGTRLLLTVAASGRLTGALNADAPWLVGAFGLLVAALVGFVVEQLNRGRDAALVLYGAQRAVAETLQRSLLPDLHHMPGLAIASRYLPGAAQQRIGGDWFDCFPVGDQDRVAIVIGDVMGHDMQAAAAMAQVRAALRAYSCETDQPASVLQRLQHLVDVLDVAPLVTVFYGVLDPPDQQGRRTLHFSNAGHLPPLVRRKDGSVSRVGGATSTIIGAPQAGDRPTGTLRLAPGSSLVLFTDGLVETVGGDVSDAIDDVAAALAAQPATATAEELSALLAARSAGPLRDDVAILIVQLPIPAGGGDVRLVLAGEHAAASTARSWIVGLLDDWPADAVDAARLIVSELVTNAVLHAGTEVTVVAEPGADRIRVSVVDGSPGLPVIKRYGATAETGRGFRLVSTLADDWGVEPTAEGGKAVWFVVERSRPGAGSPAGAFESAGSAGTGGAADLSAWPDLEESTPAPSGATFEVRILALPIAVYLLAAEHNDALLRELALLPSDPPGHRAPAGAVPGPEATAEEPEQAGAVLAESIREQFTPVTASLRHQIEAAMAEGRTTVDLRMMVPAAEWQALVALADRLDEADRLCGEGELLTLEAPAAVRHFRHWFARQVIEQASGRPPTPWPSQP